MELKDLLKYDDEEFLKNAYRTILKREIDEEGKKYYLNFLRTGKRTKKQILTNIMASPEAKDKEKIRNFYIYKFWYGLYKIPVISSVFQSIAALINIKKIAQDVRALQNSIYIIKKDFSQKIEQMNTDLQFYKKLYENQILKIDKKIDNYTLYINTIKNELVSELDINFKDYVTKELEHFYSELENTFRGSKKEIKAKLKKYIPLVKNMKIKNKKLLDCGCGRGEWLELISEEGYDITGVDINPIFVNELNRKFNVIEDNILNYLKNKTEEFSIITSFHLIEHLTLEELLLFLRYSYVALQKNGFILLETPNPKNITVGACNFYTDPTHKSPIPPHLAKFLLEYTGFRNVKIIPEKEDTGDFYEDWVNQSEDYAVIGYKL